jgi:diketogulonate reductase-like aldo/keto reductase
MLYKQLGNTGTQIPEVGIGTWDYHGGPDPLRKGLEAGALFVDTAESYGSEPVVSEAIVGLRDRVFLATKVSPQHFRRADLFKAADDSLVRLRANYIDLYQLHEPNDRIPLEETLGAMEELVERGKVRFIGVSNFSVEQLQRAQRAMRKQTIVSNQVRFSLIDRTIDQALMAYCERNKITIIAYSPLARGFQRILDCDPARILDKLGKNTGRTAVQVALNWCLCREGVVVIPKGNSVEHVLENCGASGWRLSPEQVREIDEAILYRRRGRLETLLRASVPPSAQRAIKSLVPILPRGLRRRLN